MKKILVLTVLLGLCMTGCNTSSTDNNFKNWNQCESLTAFKTYIEDITNPKSEHFVPVKDRIATFDMDGTFYAELNPTYLEYNLLMYRALDDENYQAPDDVKQVASEIRTQIKEGHAHPSGYSIKHAVAQAKAFAGMNLKQFETYVKTFLGKASEGFENMTYGQSFYKPILDVFDYLKKYDFTTYVVTGSDRFITRALVCDALDIPSDHIIGMDTTLVATNQGETDGLDYVFEKDVDEVLRGDSLLIKNLKMNKVTAITKEIGKQPILAFGNSDGDCSMLNYALSNKDYVGKSFMLVADDETRDYGNTEKGNNLAKTWKEKGYQVISMKNDFKTIYGENVVKTHL